MTINIEDLKAKLQHKKQQLNEDVEGIKDQLDLLESRLDCLKALDPDELVNGSIWEDEGASYCIMAYHMCIDDLWTLVPVIDFDGSAKRFLWDSFWSPASFTKQELIEELVHECFYYKGMFHEIFEVRKESCV